MPFSRVSRTNVDASCKYVFVLADEKPERADDSESEDRLDWSSVGTINLGPIFNVLHNIQTDTFLMVFFGLVVSFHIQDTYICLHIIQRQVIGLCII